MSAPGPVAVPDQARTTTVAEALATALLAHIDQPTSQTFAAVERLTVSANRLDRAIARREEP